MSLWRDANRWLAPTEHFATLLLYALAALALFVAIKGSPATKAAVAGWMILP